MPRYAHSWGTSNRLSRLPSNWPKLREVVGRRDNWTCQHQEESGEICGAPAREVDHIIPNDDDSLNNLRCLCTDHHKVKSSREGGIASAIARKAAIERTSRPREETPIVPAEGKPKYPGF